MSSALPLATVHEIRDACLCMATQRAARRLARRFDRAFQPVGLSNGQFSLLMALNAPGRPKLGELATFLAMDRTTLTAALKALERRGLVAVTRDERDRRARRMALTQAGHEALQAAIPVWRAEHAALERDLTHAGADRLRAALREVA